MPVHSPLVAEATMTAECWYGILLGFRERSHREPAAFVTFGPWRQECRMTLPLDGTAIAMDVSLCSFGRFR